MQNTLSEVDNGTYDIIYFRSDQKFQEEIIALKVKQVEDNTLELIDWTEEKN